MLLVKFNHLAGVENQLGVECQLDGFKQLDHRRAEEVFQKFQTAVADAVFAGELTGLVFAEVEFPDETSAAEFVAPAWFVEDVTFDDRFKNGRLAKWKEAPEELRKAGLMLLEVN